ncbi:glutamyl-tRNA reductase [soil metagenome]
MTLYGFGINFETAPVAVRERFALSPAQRVSVLKEAGLTPDAELILLSTCNRTEAFLYGSQDDKAAVEEALTRVAGSSWPEEVAFTFSDEEAVSHILGVTSGVRSQVIGDAQIFAQVKEAYREAVDADTVGTVLHRLMHTAFRSAKRVRTETAVGLGAASISSAAVAAARSHVAARSGRGLAGRHVLLIGTGQMGIAALKALSNERLGSLRLTNRSRDRAKTVADVFGADVVDWEKRHEMAAHSDVVIVACGASEPILYAADLPARPARRPVLIIDIAVPRNVERGVDLLPGYAVLDLDRLDAQREATAQRRRAELPRAEAVIAEEMAAFVTWYFHQEALRPTIEQLRATFDAIRIEEIERHSHRLRETDRDEIDRLTRSIMQKLLAVPIVGLKSSHPDSMDFVRGVRALAQIFSRPDCEDASTAEARTAADEQKSCPIEIATRADRHPQE